MKLLPLYAGGRPSTNSLPGQELDLDCKLCALHSNATTNIVEPALQLAVDGSATGRPMMLVGEGPSREDDRQGAPFQCAGGRHLKHIVRKWWDGPLLMDLATRCGAGKKLPKHVGACRPHLLHTIVEGRPSRIIALGPIAAFSLLGRSVDPLSARRGYGWLPVAGDMVPVFFVHPPAMARKNRFVREMFDEDLEWAITCDTPAEPPWEASCRIVEDEEDAVAAAEEMRAAKWFAFDVETFGRQHDRNHEVISAALCPKGSTSPWVFDYAALTNDATRKHLVELLADPSALKVGQNFKYDMTSCRSVGMRINGVHWDTRFSRRLLEPEAKASLEAMSELVGMGDHKQTLALNTAIKKLRATARGKLAPDSKWGEEIAVMTLTPDPRITALLKGIKPAKAYAFAFLQYDDLHSYCARDTVSTAMVAEILEEAMDGEPEIKAVWQTLVLPGISGIEQMEANGIAADRNALELFDNYLGEAVSKITIRLDPYDFNPGSPQQVGKLLFDKLKLPCAKFTAGGQPCTDKDVLEGLKGTHPIVDDLLEHRRLSKLKGTYAAGMIPHVRDDGRIHPNFNIDGATTGRLSCSAPNCQNVPVPFSKEGKMCRDIFVASPGYVLLEADFSQLEIRVAAMLSGDQKMKQIFLDGDDYHLRTAQLISQIAWGIPPEDVTESHRSLAKPVTFGLMYGKEDRTLAAELGVPVSVAAALRAGILGAFKDFAKWRRDQVSYARRHGCIWTWWDGQRARRRHLRKIVDVDDKKRANAERAALNTPIQGTASDFCFASVSALNDWIRDDAVPSKLVLTVHDSIKQEVREDALEEVAYHTKRIMESWPSMGVPLVVDLKVGKSWGSLKKLELAA